jgi:hypothetical protein
VYKEGLMAFLEPMFGFSAVRRVAVDCIEKVLGTPWTQRKMWIRDTAPKESYLK